MANLELEKLIRKNKATNLELPRADLANAMLSEVYLREAKLYETNLNGADLYNTDLSRARLTGANLVNATIVKTSFNEAKLRNTNLTGADLAEATFIDASLIEVNLTKATLVKADFRNASLSNVDFTDADLSNADLRSTIWHQTSFSGVYLCGSDFSKANLDRLDFSGANLRGAHLSGANFMGANLSGANLSKTNLRGANLSQANLSGADLTDADLTMAIFTDADLNGAKTLERSGVSFGENWLVVNGRISEFRGAENKFDSAIEQNTTEPNSGLKKRPPLPGDADYTKSIAVTGSIRVKQQTANTEIENLLSKLDGLHGIDAETNTNKNTDQIPLTTAELEVLVRTVEASKAMTLMPEYKTEHINALQSFFQFLEKQYIKLKPVVTSEAKHLGKSKLVSYGGTASLAIIILGELLLKLKELLDQLLS